MNVQSISIDRLKPAVYNPRKKLTPDDPEYESLRNSIVEFGLVDPIIVNADMTVIGGHQRLSVCKELGFTEVDCVVVDMDKDHEKALNVALNKIAGDWEMSMLKDLLLEIDASEVPIEVTGFDQEELEQLMCQYHTGGETTDDDDFDPDEALAEVEEPITKRGDIWQLGQHRLMCGDSTDLADVRKLMDGAKAKFVFTDPPWNVDYGADLEKDNAQGYKPRTILNDHMSTEDFGAFLFKAFESMKDVSEPGCMTYVVMSAQEWANVMTALFNNGYHWSSTIIWSKDHHVMSRKDYHTRYEPIWYGWLSGAPRICPLEDRTQNDVWDIDRPTKSEEHPTMKPLELVGRAIENSSSRGDICLDLFGGSGTTLIAAEQLWRVCYMMELDPKYCDVIKNRWERLTGDTAVLITGEGNAE